MVDLNQLKESLIKGDLDKTTELTKAALAAGIRAKDVLDKCLVPGLDEVGRKFENGEFFFPVWG